MRDFFNKVTFGFVSSSKEREDLDSYYRITRTPLEKRSDKDEEKLLELAELPHVAAVYEAEKARQKVAYEERMLQDNYGKDRSDSLSKDAPLWAKLAYSSIKFYESLPKSFSKPPVFSREIVELPQEQEGSDAQYSTLPNIQSQKASKPIKASAATSSAIEDIIDLEPESSATASVVSTFSDGINLFSEGLNKVPFAMLAIATPLLSRSPATGLLGAALAAALPQVGAVKVGKKEYQTTVFCGPHYDCEKIRVSSQESGSHYLEYNSLGKTAILAERLILAAHGYKNGGQRLEPDKVYAPDYAANYLFSGTKIIHALGCNTGKNPQTADLRPGQILFSHASDTLLVGSFYRIASYLTTTPNNYFPEPENTKITSYNQRGQIVTAEFKPLSLDKIINDYVSKENSEEVIIDQVYDSMAAHVNNQKEEILKKFQGTKEKKIIAAELKRLGFTDHTKNLDHEFREKCVREYLSKLLMKSPSAEYFNILISKKLIDVNYADKDGMTFVHSAVFYSEDKFLKALIRAGANVDSALTDGTTPAILAAKEGKDKLLEVLIKGGANLSAGLLSDGKTPVHVAANYGYYKVLDVLKKAGADLNIVDKGLFTAADIAVVNGDCKSLGVLKGAANFNIPCHNGATTAHFMVLTGKYQCLEDLKEGGADFNIGRHDGATPLILVIQEYQKGTSEKDLFEKVIITLIKYGADPKKITPFGTAYELAEGNADLIKKMKKAYLFYEIGAIPDSRTASKSHEALQAKSLERQEL